MQSGQNFSMFNINIEVVANCSYGIGMLTYFGFLFIDIIFSHLDNINISIFIYQYNIFIRDFAPRHFHYFDFYSWIYNIILNFVPRYFQYIDFYLSIYYMIRVFVPRHYQYIDFYLSIYYIIRVFVLRHY